MADERAAVTCALDGCDTAADFWFYDPDVATWTARCSRHAVEIHPSLELHALLESGYLRPVEVGRPDGPPTEPPTARAAAFRAEVEALLDHSS